MGTTQAAYPYPEPSDNVSAGADAIKALAWAIPMVQSGFGSLTGDATNARTVGISYGKPFNANTAAWAVCTTGVTTTAISQTIWTGTFTATGFILGITRNNTTAAGYYWWAIGAQKP